MVTPRDFEIDRYDPCPCGSGKRYKFCCGHGGKRNIVGTVALYGPDDKTTTKIVAGVSAGADSTPQIERFVGSDIIADPKVAPAIRAFFARHKVQRVVLTDGNLGCPHEEGMDFPQGAQCPFCPFWFGKQGSGRFLD